MREVLRFTGPADVILSRYFREHPKLGSRERNAVAEGMYAVLRNKPVYASFSESGTGPAMRRLALLALFSACAGNTRPSVIPKLSELPADPARRDHVLDSADAEPTPEHANACGAGAIAAMLAACRDLGATSATVLRHANSYETLAGVAPQQPADAVGYASVVVG